MQSRDKKTQEQLDKLDQELDELFPDGLRGIAILFYSILFLIIFGVILLIASWADYL